MGWIGGLEPSSDSTPATESDSPSGMHYRGLAMAPMLRLGSPDGALRSAAHRPRRPVVVDGAVWE